MYATTSRSATLTGVTARALHLYERRGLLKPRRTRAGYRRYSYSDMLRLERILALKALGLPLTQISQLTCDGSKAPDLLGRQRALLEERRRRIERALAAIDAIAKDAEPSGAIDRFVSESAWDRWETRLQGQASPVPRAPDRASPSRVDLFQKIHAALERDPRGRKAGPLLNEWDALLERESGGNEGHADSKRQRWAGRRNWPAGVRQYVASLFDMTPEA